MLKFTASRIYVLMVLLSGSAAAAPSTSNTTTPGTAQVASVNLKESILFAFDRDPAVAQQAAQLGIGFAQVDEARSGWLPQVALNANGGHSQTTDSSGSLKNSAAWGLTLTQRIYDFGKTNSLIDQQEAQREGYRYKLMSTMTEVAEKTALSYVEVKRYQALTTAAYDSLVGHENILKLARLRSDAGLSSSSDVLQAQTRISGLRATIQQYDAALLSAKARLAVLTGIDAKNFGELPSSLEAKQNALDTIDYSMVPSVLAAQSMVKSSQFAMDRAKAEHLPTLSLKAGRTRYESDNRSYWDDQIQLNVEAPIYQGGAVSARVKQADGARRIAVSQVDQARFDILQKASVSMADWGGAKGRMATGVAQLENAKRARDVYKNEYTLSKRSINDLLSVEQDVWQASSSKIMAEYDSWVAAVNYASAVDDLLPSIGIKKGVASTLPELK